MISGFWDVPGPTKINFLIFGDTRTPKQNPKNVLEHVCKYDFLQISNVVEIYLLTFWERRAPKHDEGPSNKIRKTWDMRSIPVEKYEMETW